MGKVGAAEIRTQHDVLQFLKDELGYRYLGHWQDRENNRNVEPELERLCDFLGVAYDDAMLRYHEHSTYSPIDPNQAGKWQTGLDRRDLRLFECAAGDELEAQGYPRSDAAEYVLRPWSKLWLRIDDALRHNRGRIEKYGISIWFWDHVTRRLPIQGAHDAIQLRINAIENSRVQ